MVHMDHMSLYDMYVAHNGRFEARERACPHFLSSRDADTLCVSDLN